MKKQSLKNITTQFLQFAFVAVFLTAISVSASLYADDQLVLFRNNVLQNDKNNISISPYGANLAIALVVPGTKGETETELKSLLGYNDNISELAKSLKITDYAKEDSPLKTATSLWIQQGFNVLPDFTETAKTNFASEIKTVDFQSNSSDACNIINEWVDKNTKSKIKKLFDTVESDTRVIAVSAIYFLAEWRRKFRTSETKEENFTLLNGEKKKVQMMRNTKGNYNYGENLNAQWLELPYKNKGFSAVIILPNNGIKPSDVVAKLTPDNFNNTLNTLKSTQVDVKVPRFEIEYSTSLKESLLTAGVKKIFSPSADLSGIASNKKLIVSDIVQKVYIKVNESGTEAAAVTGATISVTSIKISTPKEFYVDRPFIFIVKESNNILFAAQVTNP
ncbi:MAG: serpin family protein [Planctomycetaceae bacterium]|jgi:serpin B|nr:serpin family protein [Planctomycetaceae bacterium]